MVITTRADKQDIRKCLQAHISMLAEEIYNITLYKLQNRSNFLCSTQEHHKRDVQEYAGTTIRNFITLPPYIFFLFSLQHFAFKSHGTEHRAITCLRHGVEDTFCESLYVNRTYIQR